MHLLCQNHADVWNQARNLLISRGLHQKTRNGEAIYVPTPVLISISNPMDRYWYSDSRVPNPWFSFIEPLWVMAGRNDLAPLAKIVKNVYEYSDNGRTWRAGYGPRLREYGELERDQIADVIHALKASPNTRQAVMSIWNANEDHPHIVTKDRPCNMMVVVSMNTSDIDNVALDMTVINRSNDLVWGLCLGNIPTFTVLQEAMAFELGVGVGTYSVLVNNLHVYKDFWHLLDSAAVSVGESSPMNIKATDTGAFYNLVGCFESGSSLDMKNEFVQGVFNPMVHSFNAKSCRIGGTREPIHHLVNVFIDDKKKREKEKAAANITVDPSYYLTGKIQHRHFASRFKTGYYLGCATKYAARLRKKHADPSEDLRKIFTYMGFAIEEGEFVSVNLPFTQDELTFIGGIDQMGRKLFVDILEANSLKKLQRVHAELGEFIREGACAV